MARACDEIRMTILCDDTAGERGLVGKHGFSLLVERGEYRMLFDTGPDGDVTLTARRLRHSLKDVSSVVLSHGHYDHTGGLEAVLRVTGPVSVVAHPKVFGRKYAQRGNGNDRYIGIPKSRDVYEQMGALFCLTRNPLEIKSGILVSGEVPRTTAFDVPNQRFQVQEGGCYVLDSLEDDMCLALTTLTGLVVVTGCAHSGLINILMHLRKVANEPWVRAVIGGLHLIGAHESRVQRVTTALNDLGVETLVPCHCTGEEALAYLRDHFAGDLLAAGVGRELRF